MNKSRVKNKNLNKFLFITGSLSLLLLLGGCQKDEIIVDESNVILQEISTPDYSVNDEIRYEVLDGMTKEEYKEWYRNSWNIDYRVFDEKLVKRELGEISSKEGLEDYLYNHYLDKDFVLDGDNQEPYTWDEEIEILICGSGYVILPNLSSDSMEEYIRTSEERESYFTFENGYITMDDWNYFTLDEAREHVYKILKNNVETYNKEKKEYYDYKTSDEYLDNFISSQINAEEEAKELYDSLQEEVDKLYENQSENE